MKKYIAIIALAALVCSCKKSKSDQQQQGNNLGALNATWVNSSWGGVSGDVIKFTISTDATSGTITQLGTPAYGYSVNEVIFTGITPAGSGTYNCMGEYRYGTNYTTVGTRNAVMTLQNSNSQLTVDYPAINASFPEIIYVYQKQ